MYILHAMELIYMLMYILLQYIKEWKRKGVQDWYTQITLHLSHYGVKIYTIHYI